MQLKGRRHVLAAWAQAVQDVLGEYQDCVILIACLRELAAGEPEAVCLRFPDREELRRQTAEERFGRLWHDTNVVML